MATAPRDPNPTPAPGETRCEEDAGPPGDTARELQRAARRRLEHAARTLGFHSLGIAAAGRSPHADRYLAWIDAGMHGSMDYLARKVERRIDPRETLPGAVSVVVVTLPYVDAVDFPQPDDPSRGRIARYARGRDYHRVMETRLKRLATMIRADGDGAGEDTPDPPVHADPRHERYRTWYTVDAGPLLERDWAEAAGVGWLGKNGLIIDPESGSWLFLGAILTDRPYPIDAPIADQCGRCTRCLEACPTGALVEARSVDARLCISYRTIERADPLPPDEGAALHGWVYGCDICQEVCPWNTRPARVVPETVDDLAPRTLPDDLATLAHLDRARFLTHFTGTATVRAGHERIAENARAVAHARGLALPAAPPEDPASPVAEGKDR